MRQFRNILTGIALLAPLSAAWGESVTADMTADVVTGRQLDVTGKADVHITSSSPLVNSTVNLNGEYAWLFLDAVKPTRTVSDYLRFITIDGQPADISTNVRIAEYGAGSVLIPNGIDICNHALTVYTEENSAAILALSPYRNLRLTLANSTITYVRSDCAKDLSPP